VLLIASITTDEPRVEPAQLVIPGNSVGMGVWRKSLFATMHLNANLPAAYSGVPAAQVVEVGLEVEIFRRGLPIFSFCAGESSLRFSKEEKRRERAPPRLDSRVVG
jgi:hypothetical protein